MRTDLSSGAGAMARGAARGALGALVASVLALAFQAIVRHIVDIETMGLFTVATTVVVLAQLPALFGLEAGAVRYVSLGASAGDERAARGSAQAALIAGLALSSPRGHRALLPRTRDLRALQQARGDASPAARVARAPAALHEPRVRRVRARLRADRALVDDHGRAEPRAPARDRAPRPRARGRDGARPGLRDRGTRRHDLRDLAAAQRQPEHLLARARPLGPALDDRLLVAAVAQPEPLPGHAVDGHARARALRDGPPGRHLRPRRGAAGAGLAAHGGRRAGLHAAHRGHARTGRHRVDVGDAAPRLVLEPRSSPCRSSAR